MGTAPVSSLDYCRQKNSLATQATTSVVDFALRPKGYRLDNIQGSIGEAQLNVDGLVSRQPEFVGSHLRFATQGPNLNAILADISSFDVPEGPFDIAGESSGSAKLNSR